MGRLGASLGGPAHLQSFSKSDSPGRSLEAQLSPRREEETSLGLCREAEHVSHRINVT